MNELTCKLRVTIAAFLACISVAHGDATQTSRYHAGSPSCSYSLELIGGQQGVPRTLAVKGPLICATPLSDELSAISDLLTGLRGDGKRLEDFEELSLGRVRPMVWGERMADCYIAKFGSQDHRFHNLGAHGAELFKHCQIFTELEKLFADRGVRIEIEEFEHLEWVDLANLKADADDFSPGWLRSHLGKKGRVPMGGLAYFRIEPISGAPK